MKISSGFKRDKRILLKGKHFTANVFKDIKHEQLLGRQPNQFFFS